MKSSPTETTDDRLHKILDATAESVTKTPSGQTYAPSERYKDPGRSSGRRGKRYKDPVRSNIRPSERYKDPVGSSGRRGKRYKDLVGSSGRRAERCKSDGYRAQYSDTINTTNAEVAQGLCAQRKGATSIDALPL